MTDIIERAEALKDCEHGYPTCCRVNWEFQTQSHELLPKLAAELKKERAESERLQGIIDAHHDGMF
jgi:hypothetical protein